MDAAPPNIPTDEDLVAQTLQGNDQAFAELAGRHHRKIASTAIRFGKNAHETEDLLQDIFLQAWRNLSQFRGTQPFEHWLSRLAIRQCYDLLRKRQRNREDTHEDWDRMQNLAHQENNSAAAKELLDLAMLKLDAEERTVIILLELEERSILEISDLTGWSESNVKVRAFRARQKLKSILEKLHES